MPHRRFIKPTNMTQKERDAEYRRTLEANVRKGVSQRQAADRAHRNDVAAAAQGEEWALRELRAKAGKQINQRYAGASMADMANMARDQEAIVQRWIAEYRASLTPTQASTSGTRGVSYTEVYADLNRAHYNQQQLEAERAKFNQQHGEGADQNIVAKTFSDIVRWFYGGSK